MQEFGGRTLFEEIHERAALFEREMSINAPITMRAELFLEFGQELVDRLPFGGEHFEQHKAGGDAVALGNMAREADAAAFFRAEQHASLDHLGGDIDRKSVV